MMTLERTKRVGRTSAGGWLARLALAAVLAASFIGAGCYARVGSRGHHHGSPGYVIHGSSKGSPASPSAKGPKAKKAPPAKGHKK